MSLKRIASRYAKALLDLAEERKDTAAVVADIKGFTKALESKDLRLMLKSPVIKEGKKKDIFDKLFKGKMNDLTYRFFNIIFSKGREEYIPQIAEQFNLQYQQLQHISAATLIVAKALEEKEVNEIKKKLLDSDLTDQSLELNIEIDPSIIGGFIIRMGDKLYDSSVLYTLSRMRKSFSHNEYMAQI